MLYLVGLTHKDLARAEACLYESSLPLSEKEFWELVQAHLELYFHEASQTQITCS
jgi:hypothetical protein